MGQVTDITIETRVRITAALQQEFETRFARIHIPSRTGEADNNPAHFEFRLEIEGGQIKITPEAADERGRKVIADFSNELRQNTGNITWSDRIAGKSNQGQRPGSFTATYTWGGEHYYKAYCWQDIAAGLNTTLAEPINSEELLKGR